MLTSEFDFLDPIEKYNLRVPEHQRRLHDITLLTLWVIDTRISARIERDQTYVLGDNSVNSALQMSALYTEALDCNILIDLMLCQLIYRFTCAKKFKISTTSTKQLRINSWGKAYISSVASTKYQSELAILKKTIDEYILRNLDVYKNISDQLSNVHSLSTCGIENLNNHLDIKLLS